MALSLLILAAGIGSRYGKLKQMEPIGPNNETVLEYSVYNALQYGFDEVIFVLRKEFEEEFREQILRRVSQYTHTGFVLQDLNDLPSGFSAPDKRDIPWGTGHAVWCARHVLRKSFVVINADDFYGEDAFHRAAWFFSQPGLGYSAFMMSSFQLANTLSKHGPVSRAICTVDQYKMLQGIEEYSGIERLSDEIISYMEEVVVRRFDGAEVVSLNFWGFTPYLFPLLEEHLCSFLSRNLNDQKAEFYISQAISAMLAHSKVTVSVCATSGQWYGITYKEDKFLMARAISNFIRQGHYPAVLWNECQTLAKCWPDDS